MTDLLSTIKEYLAKETEINNIAIIPIVEMLPLEKEFPAIGIIDEGDVVNAGASEGLRKYTVNIAVYSRIIGDREPAILEALGNIEIIKSLLENRENFYSTGVFSDYNGCRYIQSSGARPMQYFRNEDEKSFVIIKLAKFIFTQTYIEL